MSHASIIAPATPRLRPAAPVPHTHTPTTIRFLVDLARNPIEAFGEYAYHEAYVYKRSVIRHLLMVNDPEGVRHILLDNASNYVKSDQAVKRVRPVAGTQLAEEPPGMRLDRVLRHVQLAADLGVALAIGHPAEHLQLPLGE